MIFADFYDIAEYGNVNWKGNFTPKELAQYAYDYLCEYRYSKKHNQLTYILKELVKLLLEDLSGREEGEEEFCQISYWLETMAKELGFSADEWAERVA